MCVCEFLSGGDTRQLMDELSEQRMMDGVKICEFEIDCGCSRIVIMPLISDVRCVYF